MIESLADSEVNGSYRTLSKVIWILFILSFMAGLVMQLAGLSLGRRDSGGTYLWWGGLTILDTITVLIYCLLTPAALIIFSVYLFRFRKDVGNIALGASIIAILSGISWGLHYVLHRIAYDLVDVANAIMYWSVAMVFLGICFFLMGIIYLNSKSTTLTRLTGLSFIVVGLVGLIVGYIGGFTLLPWFTIYDFPWVTTTAIIPCCLALILNVKDR
ncbi:MAG: hypothetical protein ACTSV2_02095 [Candidatus Thorarchaeota archaeon]